MDDCCNSMESVRALDVTSCSQAVNVHDVQKWPKAIKEEMKPINNNQIRQLVDLAKD